MDGTLKLQLKFYKPKTSNLAPLLTSFIGLVLPLELKNNLKKIRHKGLRKKRLVKEMNQKIIHS